MSERFDCHVHIGASDTGELYYGQLTGDEYQALMPQAGVAQAIVFPPLRTDGYLRSNAALLEYCESTEGRLRPLARVGGTRLPVTEPQLWIARRALRAKVGRWIGESRGPDVPLDVLHRYAGVKLLPHLDGIPDRTFFEHVDDLGLPVLTHAGRYATPRWIARHILPLRRGALILAHLGAFPDREQALRDAVELAMSDRRVWLDTSGIWIEDFLRYAVQRVPGRLLFGSDCPLTTPETAWRFLETSVSDAGLRRRIGQEAALEVFGDGLTDRHGLDRDASTGASGTIVHEGLA